VTVTSSTTKNTTKIVMVTRNLVTVSTKKEHHSLSNGRRTLVSILEPAWELCEYKTSIF